MFSKLAPKCFFQNMSGKNLEFRAFNRLESLKRAMETFGVLAPPPPPASISSSSSPPSSLDTALLAKMTTPSSHLSASELQATSSTTTTSTSPKLLFTPPKRHIAKPSEAITIVEQFLARFGNSSQVSDPIEAAKILCGAVFLPSGNSNNNNNTNSVSSKQLLIEAWMKNTYFGQLFDADFDWVKNACERLMQMQKAGSMRK